MTAMLIFLAASSIVGLVLMERELRVAPVAYEDKDGFHMESGVEALGEFFQGYSMSPFGIWYF